MSIGNTKAFAALSARMRWDLENIKVSSDNLARADLPDAQQKRLKPFSFNTALSGVSRTHPGHIQGKQDGIEKMVAPSDKNQDKTISDNNISQQHEMMEINESSTKMHQNTTLHKKLTQFYKTILTVSK
jgi:flagellar basal body rod protein FlgB